MTISDRELVKQALSGRQTAWEEIVDRYGRLVYSIPRRYRMSEADADDVFQSVFTILFRKLKSLKDQSRLSSWLITTTHRECWRVGKKNPQTSDELDRYISDVGSPSEEQVSQWEQQHLVRTALQELGGQCEKLLTMMFLTPAEPDYQSIADQLGMKVGSIGPTRARCFRKMQEILQRLGYEEEAPVEADRPR